MAALECVGQLSLLPVKRGNGERGRRLVVVPFVAALSRLL